VLEFISYAKANPGKLNMATAGIGGPQHIAGELFKFMAGVDLAHIPYRGSTPAVTDLVAGQVQVMFDVTATALPQVNAGKTRALGVSTKERLPSLPDVPTIDSVLKGYEALAWIGFSAPAATPTEIVVTLNRLLNEALLDPRLRQRLFELGAIPAAPNSPAEFAKFNRDEIEKWAKIIKFAGIKPE
jgi:tripartite-type tricarboxylate transporter receptor subunit TctC